MPPDRDFDAGGDDGRASERKEEECAPLREAGQGEAEGFEEAEAELIEHASTATAGPDPSQLAGEPEDAEAPTPRTARPTTSTRARMPDADE